MFSGGYSGPKEIKYLFIDGGCLRSWLDEMAATYAGGRTLDVDYGELTREYHKVFYYDALPPRPADPALLAVYEERLAAQDVQFERLASLDRFHVNEGEVRRSAANRPEQKMVDVMIAVDMLTHSFRRNMHEATLLTSDLDFKPLLDALVQHGMFVTLWYPPRKTSDKLIAAAYRSRRLHIGEVRDALRGGGPAPFVVPQAHSEPSKGDYATVLMTWTVDGGEAKLMQDGEIFVAAIPPDTRAPGMMTYYQHSDLAILRAYLADMRDIRLPNIPGKE
jgi:uncharacterized LabA/DUF88 family protein